MMLQNVLHVEDDEDIREISRVALETVGGLRLVQCGSGLEALERLESYTPDLILLDSMMPGMNGEQTLLRIRSIKRCAKIPVVFVTARVHDEARTNYMQLGAVAVIVKPFDPLTVAEELRKIWERASNNDKYDA